MTQSPTYHDRIAANIPPDVVAAIEERYGLPIEEAVKKYRHLVAAPPDVVAAIDEQCGMPIEDAVEKYGGTPILLDSGNYVSIADPPGCGPKHFAAKAEAYRLLFEDQEPARQARARKVADARAELRLDAAPVKPSREPQAAAKLGCSIKQPEKHKPKTPKRVPSPDTITPKTPLRLDIAAQVAFPDDSMSVSGLRREIRRGKLRAEMIAGKMFTTLANIDEMRKKCAVPTKAPESSSENHGGRESRGDGSSSTAMPSDVASSARQAHLRQVAQGLRNSGPTPKKPSPTISDESTSRNSAAVIRLKSE